MATKQTKGGRGWMLALGIGAVVVAALIAGFTHLVARVGRQVNRTIQVMTRGSSSSL